MKLCLLATRRARAYACTFSLALISALTLSACGEHSPSAGSGTVGQAINAIKGGSTYSEPALMGAIIDAQTKQPIEGALVYGYYATSTGTLAGGTTFGEQVKSFEAKSDAAGRFKIEAWDTGTRRIKGETRGRFPIIGVYKPGYEMHKQNLDSIRQWWPKTTTSNDAPTLRNNSYDWTKFPYELTPAKTEKARYDALVDSGDAVMMMGECGWESYAGLLLAQHDELKAMMKRTVAPEKLDAEGYLNSGDGPVPFANFYARTAVDSLKKAFKTNLSKWRCAIPDTVFTGAK